MQTILHDTCRQQRQRTAFPSAGTISTVPIRQSPRADGGKVVLRTGHVENTRVSRVDDALYRGRRTDVGHDSPF